jgi:hypothetical protein
VHSGKEAQIVLSGTAYYEDYSPLFSSRFTTQAPTTREDNNKPRLQQRSFLS